MSTFSRLNVAALLGARSSSLARLTSLTELSHASFSVLRRVRWQRGAGAIDSVLSTSSRRPGYFGLMTLLFRPQVRGGRPLHWSGYRWSRFGKGGRAVPTRRQAGECDNCRVLIKTMDHVSGVDPLIERER